MARETHAQRKERWPKCEKASLRASATFATTTAVRSCAEMTENPHSRTVLNQELRARGEDPV